MRKKHTNWKPDAVSPQNGKTFIITGANSGLGFESAKAIADLGGEVILACRSLENAENTIKEIQAEYPNAELHALALDLQSQASIEAFSKAFKQQFKRLDVLMNNAGVMNTPYCKTEDGFETQFGTNHLGHFALTCHLLDYLINTPDSRVVTVSSTGHKAGSINFRDLNPQKSNYHAFKAYAQSKLANLLFAFELQRRFNQYHINSFSLAAHPGASQTNLGRHIEDAKVFKYLNPLLSRVIQNQQMGALPQLRAALDPQIKGGEYFGPDGLLEMSGYPVQVVASKAARNRDHARQLWTCSEDLLDLVYKWP